MFRSFRYGARVLERAVMAVVDQPSEQDLQAYWAGTLDPERFEAVDAWIAALPAVEQDRLAGRVVERAGELATLGSDLEGVRSERRPLEQDPWPGSAGDARMEEMPNGRRSPPRLR